MIGGCLDNLSPNFSPAATFDDGSCVQIARGCTNPSAENYAPAAQIDDGSCVVPGCKDSAALNYAPNATVKSEFKNVERIKSYKRKRTTHIAVR